MTVGGQVIDGRTHKCGGQMMNTSLTQVGGRGNNVEMQKDFSGTLRVIDANGVKKVKNFYSNTGRTTGPTHKPKLTQYKTSNKHGPT